MTAAAAPSSVPGSVDGVVHALAGESYVADRRLATVVLLALSLKRPLFVEGEPGVGNLLFTSIRAHEGVTVVGISTVLIVIFLVVNVLVDLLQGFLDPRVRHGD